MVVGIIGCGASGMLAAITASDNGHKVIVFEKNDVPGKKILSTGNGKCNYTNLNICADFYNENSRTFFETIYNKFDRESTISFFKKIGILPYEKNGYIYPRSEQAASVVSCLSRELNRRNIQVIYNCSVEVKSDYEKICINTNVGDYTVDKLIIAAGSNAMPKTGSDGSGYGIAIKLGHTVKKPLPALCGLKCKGVDFKKISGVRCQAKVTLICDGNIVKSDFGEVQITDYGISGIPVFQISGDALRLLDEGHNVNVLIDYAREYEFNDLMSYLRDRLLYSDGKNSLNFLEGFLNSKLAELIINESKIDANRTYDVKNIDSYIYKITKLIKMSEYKVTGHRGFDNCQVCTGGVLIEDINDTLESKICKNVYFAGEIIDVDGICGGYNLQWAWSSGYVAGCLE